MSVKNCLLKILFKFCPRRAGEIIEDVLVVENNVGSPDLLDGDTDVVDASEQLRVPAKQLVIPTLQHSQPVQKHLTSLFRPKQQDKIHNFFSPEL